MATFLTLQVKNAHNLGQHQLAVMLRQKIVLEILRAQDVKALKINTIICWLAAFEDDILSLELVCFYLKIFRKEHGLLQYWYLAVNVLIWRLVLIWILKTCVAFFSHLRLPYIIFQGGMPRASYGDRHSISVIHGNQQIAFDFTSRVIDFFVITNADSFAGK